jgi:hypothetical protein
MYQRRDYRDDEKIQIGFKASGKLANATHEAAKSAKFDSTSQYLHHVVREAVAAELGVSPASLEPDAKPARAGVTMQGASPQVAAQLAQYNALIIDLQDKLAQAAKLAGASIEAPAARPSTRRR